LLYANRDKESAAYLDELSSIAEKNPNFVLKNRFGLIDADFIKNSVENLDNLLWYVVGPPPMVASVRDLLLKMGISQSKIFVEDFVGY
jgi:ferredoxin-NADP reductase